MRHVLQTGQTRCYDETGNEIASHGSGQDGESRRGLPWPSTRFEVRGEVVDDRLTGLTWTLDANIGGFPCTWIEAFDQIAELNRQQYGGQADWRLPNRNESVTTGKAGGLKDCEPLKAVSSTDSLTTIRWSTI